MSTPPANGSLQPPLVPRNGQTLLVLGIARISTDHQDERSLADQEALYRSWLDERVGLLYHLEMITGRGSGECLDREEARRARAAVESGRFDLVIAEDLGRIFRRVHAQLYCELCEDYETRLIAINDQVDTAQDNWRIMAGFATMRHELYNTDTARRIRRTLRNRFQQGGVVQTVVYGYVKPPGARTDADLRKDPDAEPVYEEMFRRLEGGAGFAEIADWLNARGVRPGPQARSGRWTCALVSQLLHNPILKGLRVRNRRMSRRVNRDGRRKSVPAPPAERLERHCPHLAFVEPGRYDRLIAQLDERNGKFRRRSPGGIDPRRNVPKKRTVWPGQHLDCGVCGRPYVYGGHGQKDHLMCRGAKDYYCWNALTVDGPLAARQLIAAIRAAIASLPDFDPAVLRMVQAELREGLGARGRQRQELARQVAEVERALQNVLAAVRDAGHSPSLLEELGRLEGEKARLGRQEQEMARAPGAGVAVPTAAEVRRLADAAFETLAVTSQEFARLLRQWIGRIVVLPYRLCDGGHPVLRASFTLRLAPLLPAAPGMERLAGLLERRLVVDLFEAPQREAFRVPVMELAANGLTQREIAWELGLALPAVQRAVALGRQVEALGTADPYLPLLAPPEDYKRLRRHRHRRFHFERLTPAAPAAHPAGS
jgi:DNA invertase Pin-like site-specific DNA recombinase